MSTEEIKKKQSMTSEAMISMIANAMDANDGNTDRQISKNDYNVFAEYTGLQITNDDSVSIDDAMVGLDQLVRQNPAKVVNYTKTYLGINIKLRSEENGLPQAKQRKKSTENDLMFDAFVDAALYKIHPGLGFIGIMKHFAKPALDYTIGKYIDYLNADEIQEVIRKCADKCSRKLPLASQLLHMSVTDSETTIGNHGEYKVLSSEQSKTRLAQIGMHENDKTEYGTSVEHFSSEQMQLKTVEFSKNSTASKVISDSLLVKLAIQAWEQDDKPQKKYYYGCMNDKTDEMLGINSCCITVTEVKENGNTNTYTGYIEDIYDYAETYTNDEGIFSDGVDSLNMAAYKAQEKGAIKPYRILIPFTVTMDKK